MYFKKVLTLFWNLIYEAHFKIVSNSFIIGFVQEQFYMWQNIGISTTKGLLR